MSEKLYLRRQDQLASYELTEIQYPEQENWKQATILQLQPMMMGLAGNSVFLKFGGFEPLTTGPHYSCMDKFILLNEIDISKKISQI